MNIVDQLRPRSPELDPVWSEQALHRIMEVPRTRSRRVRSRTGLIVAGTVAGAPAGGGVGGGAGRVAVRAPVTPPWVDRGVHELSAANHGKWRNVSMVQIR